MKNGTLKLWILWKSEFENENLVKSETLKMWIFGYIEDFCPSVLLHLTKEEEKRCWLTCFLIWLALSLFSTLIQISLLIHLSRLNFHPMHLAHFLSASLAFGLFADHEHQCYRLFPIGNVEFSSRWFSFCTLGGASKMFVYKQSSLALRKKSNFYRFSTSIFHKLCSLRSQKSSVGMWISNLNFQQMLLALLAEI